MRVAKFTNRVCSTAVWASLALAGPAWAGEEILYRPAPDWVEPADIAAAQKAATSSLLVLDQQMRIQDAQLWTYFDTASRISNPQELSEFGTIAASWLPDKGDLIVHEIAILRDDEKIDIVNGGARLDILRREESLEQRILDGELTATVAVPGLRVGDILRIRYSTTVSDQALGNEVEGLAALGRKPDFRVGVGRVRASWNADTPVRYLAGPDVELGEPVERDGFKWIEVTLPLEKADDLPRDAPGRFHRFPLLQLGTFSGWDEVSRVMAPYYQVSGVIAAGSELDRRAAAIEAAHAGQLEQAVAALALVQDDIGYLANGLDGGNYLPQSIEETWEMRYGDCKAKTVLLLALLDRLGIEGEAVLVSTTNGDSLSELLPMPGVFDHVLVRATIEGRHYWLDGTSAGASTRLAGNVPPFRYGLPLRAGGASLEPIRQVLPRQPDGKVLVRFDQRAGADIPTLFHSQMHVFGPAAALIVAQQEKMTPEDKLGIGAAALFPFFGPVQVYQVSIERGADNGEAIISADGFMTPPIKFKDGRGEQQFKLPSSNFTFSPDRARQKWRDLPVALGDATAMEVTYTVELPDNGRGYTLEGPSEIDQQVAGRRFVRKARLEDGKVSIHERVETAGGELAPDRIAEERRQAATLSRNALTLRTPPGIARRWDYAGRKDRSALAPVEKAYAAAIANDPDEVENYVNRARFRSGTFDFAGTIADLEKAIELERSAELLNDRATIYSRMGDTKRAEADFREAYDLQPNPYRAMALASAMARNGDLDGALELLEAQDGNSEVRRDLDIAMSDLDARAGRKDAGLDRIVVLLGDKPNDARLLNAKCWYLAAWEVTAEDTEEVCTRAVELAESSAPVLDSRALAYLRSGDYSRALLDAEAALVQAPEQDETLLLRGLIRVAKGDEEGRSDIREALARNPASKATYELYGFDLD